MERKCWGAQTARPAADCSAGASRNADRLCITMGFPAAGVDFPFRRSGQRAFQNRLMGGDHWSEINDSNAKGLPEKPWGRIAVAVAPSKPQVVYANIEAKKERALSF